MNPLPLVFKSFKTAISCLDLPAKFTFPFFYEPHPLCLQASAELQEELLSNTEIHALFDPESSTCLPHGKMFGVLIVQTTDNQLGYLTAFSGKLGNLGNVPGFVPPVFDLWNKDGFFKAEEAVLNKLNSEIQAIESSEERAALQQDLELNIQESLSQISQKKVQLKELKQIRKIQRETCTHLKDSQEYTLMDQDLIKQSLRDKHELKVLQSHWAEKLSSLEHAIDLIQSELNQKKELRKEKSNLLQTKLFQQYNFLNILGQEKDLIDIFKNFADSKPPAATGDCAAPKLLQYAFTHSLKPIAMAEFWWGNAPKSEIRKHKNFYPACRGKCEPVLGHMLLGMDIEPNPLLVQSQDIDRLEILFEDSELILVNKPAELLSVPGINIQDSVYTRIKALYPQATGPLIVHRLDMSTSGLLVLAKNKEAHKNLQKQFLKKIVQKRYVALLDSVLEKQKGIIELPLRVDLNDRPRQLVCHEHGKASETHWELLYTTETHSKVYFYPITGRTHQLRVHASHKLGLNAPIVGDDLYGKKDSRLHLHAERLGFHHPKTHQWMEFNVTEPF